MTAEAAPSGPPAPPPARPRLAVIDTNVWLDLHYFGDPQSQALAAALESPHWMAARCRETDAELAAVLRRPRFSSNPAERARLCERLRQWQARACSFVLHVPASFRCRDPDDQKFLDLALEAQAAVLLTKDKALLALRRNARRHGLAIMTPREFTGD